MAITLDGTNGITTPTYGGTDTSEYLVPVTAFKNRIINGAMMIDQRNAGAAITPTANAFVTDRWYFALGGDPSRFTLQQNAGAVTPPAGFTNYLGATVASAVASPNTFRLLQYIEGYNVADLAWGTASAAPITLSFWARSSLTGTFGGSVFNSGGTRSYPYTYTISAANTWEYKTVTIPGETTGTWLTTTGIGLALSFALGETSSYKGTAGTWNTGTYYSATTAQNLVNTLGATLYITGVQLEKGSTATAFDYRPYGTELTLCQRYYEVMVGDNFNGYAMMSAYLTGTNAWQSWNFKVTKRASPTIALATGASWVNVTPSYIYASVSTGVFNFSGNYFYVLASAANANCLTASAEF